MKSKSIYPYPIIGEKSDFQNHVFSSKLVTYSSDRENYYFEVKYTLDEPTLIKLIKEKKAAFVCSVANSSMYRASFKHFDLDTTHKFSIPVPLIRGNDFSLSFTYKLCANNFFEYTNPNADKIYSGMKFKLEPGLLLGHNQEDDFDYLLEDGFADFNNSSSFLRIRLGADITSTFINPERELVSVYLTKENHKLYEEAQNNQLKSLLSIIVMPIVIELVHRIKKDPGLYNETDFLWVRVLKEKFGDDPVFDDEDNCLVIAEKILANPWFNSLREINTLIDITNDKD